MDVLVIHGGGPLHGEVRAGGAKNATLPILVASLLAEGTSALHGVPGLRDVETTEQLLTTLGAHVTRENTTLRVNARSLSGDEAPYELVKTMRASVLVLGPLVARMGHARVSLPGGCAIGERPIEQHLRGLQALGADIDFEHGYVTARAGKLRGATYNFDMVTVTGTENVMMAAALADGTTVLSNCAREPEVVDLAQALTAMGARIDGAGTSVITIHGVKELAPYDYTVMPDRIEAGTFLVGGAITGGEVTVVNAPAAAMEAVIEKLRDMSVTVEASGDGLVCAAPANGRRLRGVPVKTVPYPGFPTDMQAQVMALAALAGGDSVFTETIFENRFMHVQELRRLGADIHTEGKTAVVRGVEALSGAPVMATDLRASASLVLAGLAASDKTIVSRVYHLDRGYEHMEEKLGALGATIERRPEDDVRGEFSGEWRAA